VPLEEGSLLGLRSRSRHRVLGSSTLTETAPSNVRRCRRTPHVDPRQAPPPHALPLRPPGLAHPADRAVAPGSAQSHAGHELCAARRAATALPELAAGPAVELARPDRLPGESRSAFARRRPDRRARGAEYVRFLPRAGIRPVSVR